MAEVFLAQQQGLEGFDRRVAVKRILPHLVDSPDFVKMFLGEAKLAAQLSHPNVVHIYDFGKVAGDYFIAMEYVEGVHAGQLWKLGEKGNPIGSRLSPTLVARIGADAAAALHYAHELRGNNGKPIGLVHRDVSPANLMVSFDGVVKLCDFGIAKAAALSDQLTNPGQVKGKYAYMSPEQTIAAPLDGRSDVFSLAIVLWELLTGETIVGRGDAVDSMRAIRDGKLRPIEVAAPGTPPALAKAIGWALETKRDRRATAAELAQALEAFIKSSPELATPMQLAGWVRARFTRDGTGEHDAVEPGDSTGAVPGTAAAPGTLAGPPTRGASVIVASGARSPSSRPPEKLIAASRLTPAEQDEQDEQDEMMDGAETVAIERDSAAARAIAGRPVFPAPRTASTDANTRMDDDSTLKPTASPIPPSGARRGQSRPPRAALVDATAQLQLSDLEETGPRVRELDDDVRETSPGPGSRRPFVQSAAATVPTMFEVPSLARGPSAPGPSPSQSGGRPAIAPGAVAARRRVDGTARVARRGPRVAVSIGVLLAIGLASFLIALAARSRSRASAPPDAAAVVAPADAVTLSVQPMPVDAAVVAPDAAVVALPPDAAPADEPAGILDVTTTPAGATVKVGDQSRTAPAKLALPAGHYVVTAEVRGYLSERREVDIEQNEHVAQEIVFTHKLSSPRGGERAPVPTFGHLTVKTTPYSEVFTSAGHSLGQTPLADVELPTGSHVLTFKNPAHADFARRVTITAGKTTKLSFALP